MLIHLIFVPIGHTPIAIVYTIGIKYINCSKLQITTLEKRAYTDGECTLQPGGITLRVGLQSKCSQFFFKASQ